MAKFKHVDKIKEPGNAAMDRGNAIDKLAEKYSTGQLNECPPELELFADDFTELRKIRKLLHAQKDLALDRNWKPTGWFDSNAWLRIKMDLFYDILKKSTRKIIDYKTGKIREEHKDQLELYAVGGLAYAAPSIQTFETELWYLDHQKIVEDTFTREQAEALKPKWEKRVRAMLSDHVFAPKPGNNCRWCFFGQAGKEKGGPGLCKF